MIRYGFFNAKKLVNGVYDRKYTADDVNKYFKGAMSRDGVYQFVGNQCRVKVGSGMDVIVKDGKGQIDYHWFEITTDATITINTAHATLNRYTAIIARYDATNRVIYITTTDGEASDNPAKPTPQKTDTIREIVLAYILVKAGATEITSDDIIDTIEDNSVCGFVSTLLSTAQHGINIVTELPTASASCKGSIYYTETFTKDGTTYASGYYICEPTSFTYDFTETTFTTDLYDNMPTASETYADSIFFASDKNKWYKCVKNSDGTYTWNEIAVNSVTALPTASADTKGKYYSLNGQLYVGTETGQTYKWKGAFGDNILVTKEYVDEHLTSNLNTAIDYTDTQIESNAPKLYNSTKATKISNYLGTIIVNGTAAPTTITCPIGYAYETYN